MDRRRKPHPQHTYFGSAVGSSSTAIVAAQSCQHTCDQWTINARSREVDQASQTFLWEHQQGQGRARRGRLRAPQLQLWHLGTLQPFST